MITKILFCCIFLLCNPVILNAKEDTDPNDKDVMLNINTGLPIICINTNHTDILKSEYIDCEIAIYDETGASTGKLNASIKSRGNYTNTFPKKPYNIKFKNKVSPLGFSSAKKYVLLANSHDYTLCRTAIGMKLGQIIETEWPLHFKYVEVVLNGVHVGSYLMTESIEIGQNRINIDKETGVIVEYRYDYQLNEEHKYFRTDRNNWLFEFKDPNGEDLSDELFEMAKQKINDFEKKHLALKSTDVSIEDFIDIESFVKWYYIKNVLQMDECNRFYVIENDNPETKIKMGPVWDFDLSIGMGINYKHYNYCYARNKLYFHYLANNSYFLSKVAEYHFANRNYLETELIEYYDVIRDLIRPSQQLDESIWHSCEERGVDWENEIDNDKNFLHKTFLWLDAYLKPYLPTTSIHSPINEHISKNRTLFDLEGRKINNSSVVKQNNIYIHNERKYVNKH